MSSRTFLSLLLLIPGCYYGDRPTCTYRDDNPGNNHNHKLILSVEACHLFCEDAGVPYNSTTFGPRESNPIGFECICRSDEEPTR